jgi:hypothetical protein
MSAKTVAISASVSDTAEVVSFEDNPKDGLVVTNQD